MTTSFSVKVATTNLDGTGSSETLQDTADTFEILSDDSTASSSGSYTSAEEDANASYLDIYSSYVNDIMEVTADSWNAAGQKEVSIDTVDTDVRITDFVDIDINLEDSTNDVNVDILNAKRGQIDTGSGDDIINVTVQSNSAAWNNTFEIDSGAGDDIIIMQDSENSQYTSFEIDAGEGDDIIDVSAILANDNLSDSATQRVINAGDGDDLVIGSQGNDYIDGGAGKDTIYAGEGNDIVSFDSDDVADGGEGFDAIVVSNGISDMTDANFTNFEAIIGESEQQNIVFTNLTDGLIIALGDDDDILAFNGDVDFEASDLVLDTDMYEDLDSMGVDYSSLSAYTDSISGDTVWTDVDLLA